MSDESSDDFESRHDHPYKCEYCNAGFYHPVTKEAHERSHALERPVTLAQISSRHRPVSMMGAEQENKWAKNFKCGICNKYFNHPITKEAHQRAHDLQQPSTSAQAPSCFQRITLPRTTTLYGQRSKNEQGFTCQYCNKHFYHPITREAHERSHPQSNPFKCRYCGKSFFTFYEQKMHERTHMATL